MPRPDFKILMGILEAKKIESENLKIAMRRFPRFFETQTFIDNQKFLEKYGISIPAKKKLPSGYLKLWPQDFIVEEITIDGELQTVFPEKFLSRVKEFSYQDPVIYATLVKCGLSTIEAVEELAKILGLRPKKATGGSFQDISAAAQNIKFAGIKDKHAITSQLISIKESEIDETASHLSPRSTSSSSVIEKLHLVSFSNFFIKNVFSGERELHLGSLRGNQFTILIRTDPNFKKEDFSERLKEVERKGFFNFFYLQRFGVPRLTNPHCGFHILKGDYEKAVFTAICKPGERELFYFQSLRKEIEKLWGDWEEIGGILDLFPLTFQGEKKLIDHLDRNPNDFIGAINQIPRVAQLWLTSFAALLFNRLLSSYLQKEKEPPATLPLVLGRDEKSWLCYKDLLSQTGIFSATLALKNLKPFPFIFFQKKDQRTVERVKILSQKVIPEGVILNFILSKGCYATTFLSHLFNLASGNLPKKFSNLPIDTKANLGQPSLEEILNKFTDVVSSPSWRLLWRIY